MDIRDIFIDIYPELKRYITTDVRVVNDPKRGQFGFDEEYIDRWKSRLKKFNTLWFIGSIGLGKTTAAVQTCIAYAKDLFKEDLELLNSLQLDIDKAQGIDKEFMQKKYNILVIELKKKVKQTFAYINMQSAVREINIKKYDAEFSLPDSPVIVFDEFGWIVDTSGFSVDDAVSYLSVYIEKRYAEKKKQIIITNHKPVDIAKQIPSFARSIDRLLQAGENTRVYFDRFSKDYRTVKEE